MWIIYALSCRSGYRFPCADDSPDGVVFAILSAVVTYTRIDFGGERTLVVVLEG